MRNTFNISIRHPQQKKDKSGSCASISTAGSSQRLIYKSFHKDMRDLIVQSHSSPEGNLPSFTASLRVYLKNSFLPALCLFLFNKVDFICCSNLPAQHNIECRAWSALLLSKNWEEGCFFLRWAKAGIPAPCAPRSRFKALGTLVPSWNWKSWCIPKPSKCPTSLGHASLGSREDYSSLIRMTSHCCDIL